MSNGTTILSTTLPTIIGMGVVSKTTDTMFAKKGIKHGKGKTFKIYQGKRGGKYVVRRGRKIYL